MRRLVDHVLCSLPFEQRFFRERGCNATFVGHPFFDEVARQEFDPSFMDQQRQQPGPLVAILPGSRTLEVTHNLPVFLKAAAMVRAEVPNVRFAVAAFKAQQAEFARQAVAASGLPIEVHVGRTPELIRLAECCMACSGSVSLELLHQTKPTVIHYWISPLARILKRFLLKVKYFTLVNLLNADDIHPADLSPYDPSQPDANRVLFPEYLNYPDHTSQIAQHVVQWLRDPAARQRCVAALDVLKQAVAHGGASSHAARYIADHLPRAASPIQPPHFLRAAQHWALPGAQRDR
jgi:lipid-A-disaccharide synthase